MKKRIHKLLKVILSLVIVVPTFLYSATGNVSAAEEKIIKGKQTEPLILMGGYTYVFDNVEVRGNAKQPSAVWIEGDVSIILKGENKIYGADASWNADFSKSSESGAGIEVSDGEGYKVTIKGDKNASLYVKGGNASRGADGENGTDGDDNKGGRGGKGGFGGNGASAGIGGRGGRFDTNYENSAGKNSGQIVLEGTFKLTAIGGSGGAGGKGGNGGHSDSYYYFFACEVSAGGGGGGGGGGGFPAAAIGGGGASGTKGGDGTGGQGRSPSTAAVNVPVHAGGGGGGGRGWGAGGGGGGGFFAWYQGRDKYSNLRPQGGRGGTSPTDRGEGGQTGIMEATLPGSGGSPAAYTLVVGSYSGDFPSIDDKYINKDGGRRAYRKESGHGYRYVNDGTLACKGSAYIDGDSGTHAGILDTAADLCWAFVYQDQGGRYGENGQTPEAHNGTGLGRRYELPSYPGEDANFGEKCLRGNGQTLQKSEGVITDFKSQVDQVGQGGGTNNKTPLPNPIRTIYDLSDPGTKVIFNPSYGVYNGKEIKPSITIYSAGGVLLNSNSFDYYREVGNGIDNGDEVYQFLGGYGKNSSQYVINSRKENFIIKKGNREDYLTANKYNVKTGDEIEVTLNKNVNDNCTVKWDIKGSDSIKFTSTDVHTNTKIKVTEGIGYITVVATISEGDHYNERTTEEIRINIVPPGAELFNIQTQNQTYNGHPIELNEEQLKVYYGEKYLKRDVDYKAIFSNNTNAGAAKVQITGIGSYSGEAESWFIINPAPIEGVIFENADYKDNPPTLPNLYYTGSSQTSVPINGIKFGNKLVEGTDYMVSYSEMVEVGKVMVSVIGLGNFTETTTLTYDILPTSLKDNKGIVVMEVLDETYDGKEKKPIPNVLFNDKLLVDNKDFTLTYKDNIDAGTGTIYVKGKGNFTNDVIEVQFGIKKRSLTIIPDENQYKFTGEYDPDYLTFKVDNLVADDKIEFEDGTKLGRLPGESIGKYRMNIGSLKLSTSKTSNDNDNYTISLTAETRNFDVKPFDINEVATIEGDFNEKTGWFMGTSTIIAPEGYWVSRGNELESNDVPRENSQWQDTMLAIDGDFSAGYTYYLKEKPKPGDPADKVYHVSSAKSLVYKQDSVVPDLRINFNDIKIYDSYKETVSYKTYFNTDISAELISSDSGSGVNEVAYYLSSDSLTLDELKNIANDEWTLNNKKEVTVDIKGEQKNILYTRVTDVAGHVAYVNSEGFIIDQKNPVIKLDYANETKWVADENAFVDVEVTDNLAGIKDRNLDYQFKYSDGRETNIKLLKLDSNDKTVISDLPNGEYDVVVTAKDNANNIAYSQKHIKKDTILPLLQLKGNLIDYAAYKDIEIVPSVGPSGVDKIWIQRQDYGVQCELNGTWKQISNDDVVALKTRVDENGTYYLKYENGAGAISNIANISFDRIDKAKPIVDFSARDDNGNYTEKEWTGSSVEVSFMNKVTNLGPSQFSYRTNADPDASAGWSTWKSVEKANDYICILDIAQSGKVKVEMRITSAAGISSDIESMVIYIDKQRPTASIVLQGYSWDSIIENPRFDAIFNTNQEFVISSNDKLSGIKSVQYLLLDGNEAKQSYTEEAIENIAKTKGWQEGIPSIDGVVKVPITPNQQCVLYTKITDKIGNFAYVSSDGVILDNEPPTMIIDTSVIKNYGPDNDWITEENASLPITLEDALSGPNTIKYSYELNGVLTNHELDIREGMQSITSLDDGKYKLSVIGNDLAGNETKKEIDIQKDSVKPKLKVTGDTINIATKQKVNFDREYGIVCGLDSFEYQYVEAGETLDDAAWNSIITTYQNGYEVVKNGTMYVRIKDKLGRTDETVLVFNNIKHIDAEVAYDVIDPEGNVIVRDSFDGNWNPAIKVRFYNNPKEVSDFTYEYRIDSNPGWIKVNAINNYAYIDGLEGIHTYEVRVRNNADASGVYSKSKKVTVKVDATKPLGELKLESSSEIWNNVPADNNFTLAYKEKQKVILQNVKDVVGSSGLDNVEYYILTGEKNEQVTNFPVSVEDIQKDLAKKWLPLSRSDIDILTNGGTYEFPDLVVDQEYMLFVKIRDVAGNVTYIATPGISIDATNPTLKTSIDYSKYWITNPNEDVSVVIQDNLSGVSKGKYAINQYTDTTINILDREFTCNERDGKLSISANDIGEGMNVIVFDVTDKVGNVLEQKELTLYKDTVIPTISVKQNDAVDPNITSFVDINVGVGKSGVKSVTMSSNNGLEIIDITDHYQTGQLITRDGTYEFTVTNNAGVTSKVASITYNNLGLPPTLTIEAKKGNKQTYESGTWSSGDVILEFSTKELFVGQCTYYYSVDDGKTWKVVTQNDEGTSMKFVDNGEYKYLYRVASPTGAYSDSVEFTVCIDSSKPEFSYELTPKVETNLWVDLTIIPKDVDTAIDYEYSFDSGQTYQSSPTRRFEKRYNSNAYVPVVVKNKAGATAEQLVRIHNIDRLAPVMSIYRNEVTNKNMYSISMDVQDDKENLDFISTGVNQVFITKENPYSETNVRTLPNVDDYVMEQESNGLYETFNEFTAPISNNQSDNYWIISTDKVGNYNIKSFRVAPTGEVIEEPDLKPDPVPEENPEQPGKPENPSRPIITPTPGGEGNHGGTGGSSSDHFGDIVNTIEKNENSSNPSGSLNINSGITGEIINQIISSNVGGIKDEKDIIEKLLKLPLDNDVKQKLTNKLNEINKKNTQCVLWWIILVILLLICLMYWYRDRRVKKEIKEINEELDKTIEKEVI